MFKDNKPDSISLAEFIEKPSYLFNAEILDEGAKKISAVLEKNPDMIIDLIKDISDKDRHALTRFIPIINSNSPNFIKQTLTVPLDFNIQPIKII